MEILQNSNYYNYIPERLKGYLVNVYQQYSCTQLLTECIYHCNERIVASSQKNEIALYSISRAAKLMGIGYSTLSKLIDEGKIPVVNVGNTIKISHQEIVNFINVNKVYHHNILFSRNVLDEPVQKNTNVSSDEILEDILSKHKVREN